tara:strand:- start:2820 stop:3956 length:1137 start_codon:yes stop_codon:yes gene_type:complete
VIDVTNSITYVFGNGRTEKIESSKNIASEFFYGYFQLYNESKNIDIIENNINTSKAFQKVFLFIDKVLRKLTNLPFYLNEICSFKNFKILRRTDTLIVTNDRLALSILPLILLENLFSNFQVNVFIMGFFGKEKPKYFSWLQEFFMKTLIHSCNIFLFLGKGEYDLACRNFHEYKHKFKYFPFCVDSNFWTQKIPDYNKEEYFSDVIFVGNDGNRDFSKIIKIASELPNLKFNILTSEISKENELPHNINLITSNWNESILTDIEMKKYYTESRLSVIPLKNSIQPSGQSVALQSMICKTPVIISKTDGFWDPNLFKNNENILFPENNSLDAWCENIKKIINDEELANKISKNSYYTVTTKLNMEKFILDLKEIIFDQ